MKQIYLGSLSGKVPDGSRSMNRHSGRVLKLDAAQIQPSGGEAVARKIETYFANAGERSPLTFDLAPDDDGTSIEVHREVIAGAVERIMGDATLEAANRREMAMFLSTLSAMLQRGNLPVVA